MTPLVDWDLARSTGSALARTGPRVSAAEAAAVVAGLELLVELADGYVRDYTGLVSAVEHPPARVIDRPGWITQNIAGLRQVVDEPLAQLRTDETNGSSRARRVTAKVTGVQAGGVMAYVSGRVLGQYDVFGGEAGQLLLVAQNIVEAERKLGVDPRDFRLWVCLHEVTHRAQFTSVPWLRGYFLSQVRSFILASQPSRADGSNEGGDQHDESLSLAERARGVVATLSDAVRDEDSRSSMVELVTTPRQREIIERLTALMTLLEGHADFVMDGVGPNAVPSVALIREKFNARRRAGNPLTRVIRRLLGIDLKMQQYAQGRSFVERVVAEVGMAGFNTIWSSPTTLPSSDELSEPGAWVARVSPSTTANPQ